MVERIYRALERARLVEETADARQATHVHEMSRAAANAHVSTADRKQLRGQRIIFSDDAGPAASAYRMLRAQFLQRVRAHELRTIGVVSAVDGEGKTLTAVNLALSIAAEPNQTALLVDLDLRRPSVARLLGLPAEQGLEAWFSGQCPIERLFWRIDGIERLRILPTITPVAGSSELLASARLKELLHEFRTRYADRLVLLDLPPMLLTDDMLTIAPQLDAVILVAAEGHTRREDLTRTRELLGAIPLLGTVLNRSSESEQRAY
jgi:protein-tyrosine kinase